MIFNHDSMFILALIYVDDVILAGTHIDKINEIKRYLDKEFTIKDLGPLKSFLGVEVARSSRGMVLSQRKYTLDLLREVGMEGCRPCEFPMEL